MAFSLGGFVQSGADAVRNVLGQNYTATKNVSPQNDSFDIVSKLKQVFVPSPVKRAGGEILDGVSTAAKSVIEAFGQAAANKILNGNNKGNSTATDPAKDAANTPRSDFPFGGFPSQGVDFGAYLGNLFGGILPKQNSPSGDGLPSVTLPNINSEIAAQFQSLKEDAAASSRNSILIVGAVGLGLVALSLARK